VAAAITSVGLVSVPRLRGSSPCHCSGCCGDSELLDFFFLSIAIFYLSRPICFLYIQICFLSVATTPSPR
jgi:hypothetical protein